MNKTIHGHLVSIGTLADQIRGFTGHRPDYMPITTMFATVLEKEGFIPQFDHVRGYGLCWLWMIWDNLQIVSPID